MSNSSHSISAIILAAGKGTRMKSKLPKVLHPVAGTPILQRIISTLNDAGLSQHCLVLGGELELFEGILAANPTVSTVIQNNRLGTGDAVASALVAYQGASVPSYAHGTMHSGVKISSDYVLITAGDTPALDPDLIKDFIQQSLAANAKLAVIGMRHEQPFGYGRLVIQDGGLDRIVEEKDANAAEKAIQLCNSGVIFAHLGYLEELLHKLDANNAQSEYYLTDCFNHSKEMGERAFVYETSNFRSFDGVNNRQQLCQIESWLVEQKRAQLMDQGVTFKLPESCYIEDSVSIGQDSEVGANCVLLGQTIIGERCQIGHNSVLKDQKISSGSVIKAGSVLYN